VLKVSSIIRWRFWFFIISKSLLLWLKKYTLSRSLYIRSCFTLAQSLHIEFWFLCIGIVTIILFTHHKCFSYVHSTGVLTFVSILAWHSGSLFILFFFVFEIDMLLRYILDILNTISQLLMLNRNITHLRCLLTLRCFRFNDRKLNILTYHQARQILHWQIGSKRLQISIVIVVAHGRLLLVLGWFEHLWLGNILM